jgi:hypothetical protein
MMAEPGGGRTVVQWLSAVVMRASIDPRPTQPCMTHESGVYYMETLAQWELYITSIAIDYTHTHTHTHTTLCPSSST